MIKKDLAMLAQHIYPGKLSSANGTLIHSLLLVHLKYVEVICQEFSLARSLTSPSSTLLFKRSFSSSWCHSRWVASAYLKANLQSHGNSFLELLELSEYWWNIDGNSLLELLEYWDVRLIVIVSYFLLQRWQSNLCSPCSSRT